jgi:hypothetical protein
VENVPLVLVGPGKLHRPASFDCRIHLIEEMTMISLLGPQDEVVAVLAQILDMGRVGAEAILDDHTLEVRMFPPELGQKAPGGLALAILLLAAVLLDDHLGTKRDHFPLLGMDDGRPSICW